MESGVNNMLVKTILRRNKSCRWVLIYQQQELDGKIIKSLIANYPMYCFKGDEYFSHMKVLAYGYDPVNDLLEIWVKR